MFARGDLGPWPQALGHLLLQQSLSLVLTFGPQCVLSPLLFWGTCWCTPSFPREFFGYSWGLLTLYGKYFLPGLCLRALLGL